MWRIILGTVLLVAGVWGFNWYHNALWTSGGMDTNRNPLQYYVPYGVTAAVALTGAAIGWRGIKAIKR